jgi:hypothetical protein
MQYRTDYKISDTLATLYGFYATRRSITGLRSTYKNIPIKEIDTFRVIVDGSQRFYVMYRGTRKNTTANATPKADAHSFDVYIRSDAEVAQLRHERIKYLESKIQNLQDMAV